MFKRLFPIATATAATLAAGAALAGPIAPDSTWDGKSSVTVNGVTISARNNLSGQTGVMGVKDIPNDGVGVGVQGLGNNEIDGYDTSRGWDSEVLSFSFSTASVINQLQIGLLFDGPEYTDYQESAGFKVSYADGTSALYTLTALFPGLQSWDGAGSWVGMGLNAGQAGLWTGTDPFGDKAVLQLDLFAKKGTCGTVTACTDQSDYVFRSLTATAVPEPGTLVLLGAGLLGMGWATRRGRAARAAA